MYIPKQWQEKQSWLTQNRSLLSKHLMLRHLLSLLGKNTEHANAARVIICNYGILAKIF